MNRRIQQTLSLESSPSSTEGQLCRSETFLIKVWLQYNRFAWRQDPITIGCSITMLRELVAALGILVLLVNASTRWICNLPYWASRISIMFYLIYWVSGCSVLLLFKCYHLRPGLTITARCGRDLCVLFLLQFDLLQDILDVPWF